MAVANPLQTGQVALACQLCIETNKIKWYCLKCEYYLCKKCRDIHNRVKSDDKHDIVKKEDIATHLNSQDQNPESISPKVSCRNHKELYCHAFCKTCKESVCTVCISGTHTTHETIHMVQHLDGSCINSITFCFRIQKQYITNWPSVYDILCLNDYGEKSMLLYNNDKQIVKKATLKKSYIRMHQGYHLNVNKMALTTSGDRLFSVNGKSVIYSIPESTGNFDESRYDIAPLLIISIHILNDRSVVLGARERKPPFMPSTERKVIVLNTDGTQKMVHQFDRNNQPLFTVPYRISSNANRSLCVIDCISEHGNGRLVILKQTGELLAIYTGNREDENVVIPFTPVAIVTTRNDAIIVADDDHHMLHVVDYHGHCFKLQDTRYFEIYFPLCLDIDNEGRLYVGCGTNRENNGNAKLSILRVDGF